MQQVGDVLPAAFLERSNLLTCFESTHNWHVEVKYYDIILFLSRAVKCN